MAMSKYKSKGDLEYEDVKAAKMNARAINKFITDSAITFDADNISTLVDPSREEILMAMKHIQIMSTAISKISMINVFLYYSGHGIIIDSKL
jgi:hypothetical protein